MVTYLTGGLCCWRSLQDAVHADVSLRSATVLIRSEATAPRVQRGALAVALGRVQAVVQVLALELGLVASHGVVLEVAEDVGRGGVAGRGVSLFPPLEQHLLAEAQLGRQVGDVADGESQSLDLCQGLSGGGHRRREVGPEVMQGLGQIPHPHLLLLAGALPLFAADPGGPARLAAASGQRAGRGLEALSVSALGRLVGRLRGLLVGRGQAGVQGVDGGEGLGRADAGEVRVGEPLVLQAVVEQRHRGGIHVVRRDAVV